MTGVAIVNPTPELSTVPGLAAEVLFALGKRFDALDREGIRNREQAWDLALVWLRAEGVRHIIVLDAHRVARRLGPAVCQMRSPRRVVWLVVRHEADAEALDDIPTTRSSIAELLTSLPRAADTTDAVSPAPVAIARFRELATPVSACAMTLAAIADLDPCGLAPLLRSSVDRAGRAVSVDGRSSPIPAHARALVWAQLLVRPRARGCHTCLLLREAHRPESQPLFYTSRGHTPAPPELAAWLRRSTGSSACRDLMLNVWPAPPHNRIGRHGEVLSSPLMTTCRTHWRSRPGSPAEED